MADINLKEYLKNVAELESSIYNQKEILENSKAVFSKNKPTMQTVTKRTAAYPPKPVSLEKGDYRSAERKEKDSRRGIARLVSACVFMIIGIIMLIASVCEVDGWPWFLVGGIACIVLPFIAFMVLPGANWTSDECVQNYEKAMAEYQAQCEQINQKNAALEKDFENRQRKANAEFDKKRKIYEENSREITTKLNSNLSETERILKSYYDKDIIFEKYRNLVAMTTMYEYFASGRCSELEGPNGAYNLFEQETRQNVIITNLQDINQHLGDIKNNQFVLYQAMNQGLETMNKISADISAMANSVKSIEQASQITAYFAEISARNETFQSLSIII